MSQHDGPLTGAVSKAPHKPPRKARPGVVAKRQIKQLRYGAQKDRILIPKKVFERLIRATMAEAEGDDVVREVERVEGDAVFMLRQVVSSHLQNHLESTRGVMLSNRPDTAPPAVTLMPRHFVSAEVTKELAAGRKHLALVLRSGPRRRRSRGKRAVAEDE